MCVRSSENPHTLCAIKRSPIYLAPYHTHRPYIYHKTAMAIIFYGILWKSACLELILCFAHRWRSLYSKLYCVCKTEDFLLTERILTKQDKDKNGKERQFKHLNIMTMIWLQWWRWWRRWWWWCWWQCQRGVVEKLEKWVYMVSVWWHPLIERFARKDRQYFTAIEIQKNAWSCCSVILSPRIQKFLKILELLW